MNRFYGLIGEKLGHSFSPQIHNIILNKLKLQGEYRLFEIEKNNLKRDIESLKANGAKGLNVTVPYKVEIMNYLNNLSPEAEKMGAVNTILFNEDILTGYNTDYYGFGASLKKEDVDVRKRNALILGTGGSAKAVAQYLIDNGVNGIIFVSRDPEKAKEKLFNDRFFIGHTKDKENDRNTFKVISYDELFKVNNFDLIINCTPCGMYPKVEYSPIGDKNILASFSTAIDLIYNPEETLFLKQAKEMGLKASNGLYMLVAQAVGAQEIWQGIKIEDKLVEEIYEDIRVVMYGETK